MIGKVNIDFQEEKPIQEEEAKVCNVHRFTQGLSLHYTKKYTNIDNKKKLLCNITLFTAARLSVLFQDYIYMIL